MKKKIYSTVLCLAIALSSFAKSGNGDKVLREIKSNTEDAFSISLSKKVIDAFDIDLDLNGKEKVVKGDFAEGNLLIVDNELSASDVKKLFLKEGFREVDLKEEKDIKIETEGDEVYLLIKKEGKITKEAHFVVAGEEKTTVLSIYGDMRVENK